MGKVRELWQEVFISTRWEVFESPRKVHEWKRSVSCCGKKGSKTGNLQEKVFESTGKVQNLRRWKGFSTGEVFETPGESVRNCVCGL